jgi:hypothetical protein
MDKPRERTDQQEDTFDERPEMPGLDEEIVEEEEDAAAAEASRIGGRSGMEGMDPAERAYREAGGGEDEGFEESEQLLEDQAEHGDPLLNPLTDTSETEAEPDPGTYGEADEIESTETDEDLPPKR